MNEFKLEQLDYQQDAIKSVINVFAGQQRNTFDNACFEEIRSNLLTLTDEEIKENISSVIHNNQIDDESAQFCEAHDLCIEMETGTGKTLVYLKTIYELYNHYGFTKFIILVPSVAIREGVLSTLATFRKQLADIYTVEPNYFEYSSKQLPKVRNFVEDQHPQIMVMTLQSFNSDDRILNQAQREDLFSNMPYIEALAKTNPIILMDEPQEGMDTPNAIERIAALNPMFKIRYSATHKLVRNLIYRLTPFDSYKQGLVKKIEVLTVAEKNDEASMKVELSRVELGKGDPKAILKAWHLTAGGYKFKNTKKLSKGDSLARVTGNVIYRDYIIDRIVKPIRESARVEFTNRAVIREGEQAKDYSSIFGAQLYWLIDTHFRKRERLKEQGIKCLSLIFIDRVANYVKEDGVIRTAFIEQYKKVYQSFYHRKPSQKDITRIQGYYFAQTGKGDFTDNAKSMSSNRELYDLILKDKKTLLSLDNPVEFIFSHSALGVGWDNPNVFNIATLNQSYSEIKKRQEIGRGLRICVNQMGQRVYDLPDVKEGEETNLLTVIPNETYQTFVTQYQSEIEEIYGTTDAGAETRNSHKGSKITERRIKRNNDLFRGKSFKEFWKRLAKKTDYIVAFDENNIISRAIEALDRITIPEHYADINIHRIRALHEDHIDSTHDGQDESWKLNPIATPIDLIGEISDSTSLAYPTVFQIMKGLTNHIEIIKNPARFLQEAIRKIKNIELDEMLRAVNYRVTGQRFDLSEFEEIVTKNSERLEPTPQRGIYDYVLWDSNIEKDFASEADRDSDVVCFLKLPPFYKIPTPIGEYNPDFGIVMKKKKMREEHGEEYYFVIETKGTNNLDDTHALTNDEIYKIKYAQKHFEALGIEARLKYIAPVKEYAEFKER